jgi:peptide/nickel transport system substrate-binding protein
MTHGRTSEVLSRRTLLRRTAAAGLSIPMIAALLAACRDDDGDDEDDEDIQDVEEPTDPDPLPDNVIDDEPPDDDPEVDDDTPDETPLPRTGGTINVYTTFGDTGIRNPILSGSDDAWTQWIVFSRLFKYDDHGNILYDLAERVEFSDDGLTVSFDLVETHWHDGASFTSDDVIFTFDTIRDENTNTPLWSRLQVDGDWVQWSAPNARTVDISMNAPFAPLLFSLSQIPIIPKHALEESTNINTDPFNTSPIGTGPYRWVERVPNQYQRYERFDDYYKGAPAADGWTVYFITDATAGSAALDAGEIDMMFAPPEIQPRYEDNPDVRLLYYVYFTPITLAFNHRHPAVREFEIRRAIAHAIDRVALNEAVTGGRGLIANNHYAATGPLEQFNDAEGVSYTETYRYDPGLARQILDDAGWVDGATGARERDGQTLSLTLLTYAGFDEYLSGQIVIQEMLGNVGIEVISQVLDYTTLQALWQDADGDPAERALELHEWPHPFEQDPDVYNELHSGNHPPGDNYMWFADAEVDDLIERGRGEVDLETRIRIYHDLDRRRLETLPALPLYCAVDGWVISRRVESRNTAFPLDTTPNYRWYQRAFPQDLHKV